jgi:hypothetical protein
MSPVPWRIKGEEAGGCNCAWGCPCQFNALPTTGRCEGLMAVQIAEGQFGETRLDGVRFAAAFSWPGAIHEGNGTYQLILDARMTEAQRQAITAVASGSEGGAVFEIFAGAAPNRSAPLVLPIDIETDRERRTARVTIPGVVEYLAEPIKSPVTGEEHRAQIRLPGGFEYKEAEMGNAVRLKVTAGPVAFEHQNTYAQFNAFEWSNQTT